MKRTISKPIILIVVLAAAGLACNAISSLAGGGDTTLLKDDFSDSGSGWGTGTDSKSSIEYVDGGLNMQVFQDNFFTWSNPGQEAYESVHMEVTAKNPTKDGGLGFGLMCDKQSDGNSYYYFAITPSGEYVIGRSQNGQEDTFLTNNDDWGTSDLIAENASSYRMYADCAPGALTLYVDGHRIDSASDTTYTSGGIGLFLWSGDNPSGEVTFDDFTMVKLK